MAEKNKVWVADITYIRTLEGDVYLASVMDLYSRKIVGWAMEDHMEQTLVDEALKHALMVRKPAKGLIHHSDRGAQLLCNRLYKNVKRARDYN
ncbi:MAG: DDE-type integrase/transposase/recombinase [Psychrobacillus psychrodurans]